MRHGSVQQAQIKRALSDHSDDDEATALKTEYEETVTLYEIKSEESTDDDIDSDDTETIKMGKTTKRVKTKRFVRFRFKYPRALIVRTSITAKPQSLLPSLRHSQPEQHDQVRVH